MRKIYIKPQVSVLRMQEAMPFAASPIKDQGDHADSRKHDFGTAEGFEWEGGAQDSKGGFWE